MHGDPVNQIPRFRAIRPAARSYQRHKAGAVDRGAGGERQGRRGQRPGAGGPAEGFSESLEEQMFNANKRDWIDCIKSRNQPFCGLEWAIERRSSAISATCRCASAGRTIHWDPEKEVVIGDKEAAAMCTKQYRAPWDGILRSLIKVS